MRERVTFVHRPGDGLDPDSLDIQDVGLVGPHFETTRQDRLTVPIDELPSDIAAGLVGLSQLDIKWASAVTHDTLDPFGSRLSPGFHLTYTPLPGGAYDSSKICSLVQGFAPLGCAPSNAFTESASSQDQPGSPGRYFYEQLDDLDTLVKTIARYFCADLDSICQARAQSLYTAASLDISYDAAAETLRLTALWPFRSQGMTVPASTKRRTEVGILEKHEPPNLAPDEVGISGILVVLGEQKKPSPTMFSFPSRHRVGRGHFSSSFVLPTGLHPSLRLSLSSSLPPEGNPQCAPYAFLTLPKTIFADRYQFEDELFLASKNLTASRYTSLPVDLEAPAYTTETWGSHTLLELKPPMAGEQDPWTVEIPLHLRYLRPSASGKVDIEIPYPAVFWACPAQTDAKMSDNPFDRTRLEYDALFDDGTVFWHVKAQPENGSRIMSGISVPVLTEGGDAWIGLGTGVFVTLGFAWVLWTLVSVFLKTGYQQPQPSRKKQQ